MEDRFNKGMATRRAVLGADYVDKATAGADDFNRPLQQIVTEWAWDGVWNRPGLDRKTRSMLVVAMLTALNRPHELRLHLVGAINNGVSREELREVLMQTAAYCGLPAAVDSFRIAREVLASLEAGKGEGKAEGEGTKAPAPKAAAKKAAGKRAAVKKGGGKKGAGKKGAGKKSAGNKGGDQ